MKISDGAIKLLKEYAARPMYGIGTDLLSSAVYDRGIQDGITVLAEQLLEQIKDEETTNG